MVKKLTAIVIAFLIIPFSAASAGFDPNNIVELRVYNIDREGVLRLTQMGADIDGVWGNTARIYTSSDMLEQLETMGYMFTIQRPSKESRQGYHTYSELGEELKIIEAACPEICRLHNIGKSYEGRDLWFVQISDNVGTEEDEPEFKYISTMHGDEPVGTELCLELINLLTKEYGTDSRITELVSETEIWIMPLMNPDGYVHRSRYNSQGTDLNRSFPDRVSDPYNTTEGRATETQRLMEWGFSHSPILAANFHTGATLVNYPYDSDFDDTATYSASPDDDLFIQLSLTYSSLNEPMYDSPYFQQGITNGVQWYTAYGGMQDWNYEWRGCNELTIELYDTKWPPYSEIPGLWEDNREAMLSYMAWSLRGIRGIVTDAKTGEPLDASVRIVGIEHDVYTDPDVGDYHRILLPGEYSVSFSADGYVTKTVSNIVVDKGNAARLDVALSPQPDAVATLLTNRVPVKDISQDLDRGLYYKIQVPSDAVNLQIFTHGGTGDCDLYVRYGQMPIDNNVDQYSVNLGNDETVMISDPQAGEWYILLQAYQAFESVSLTAGYTTQSCAYTLSPSDSDFPASGGNGSFNVNVGSDCFWTASPSESWIDIISDISGAGTGKVDFKIAQNTDQNNRTGTIAVMNEIFTVNQKKSIQIITLTNDTVNEGLSGESGSNAYYKIDVPYGQSGLNIELQGGEGDCTLYVKHGEIPTREDYDNVFTYNESSGMINFPAPSHGEWYIMLYTDSAYSGMSLKASYSGPDCSYILSEAEVSSERSGGTGNITVTVNENCSWTALSNTDWITITEGNSATGDGTVSYSVSANENPDERIGTLQIADISVTIRQEGVTYLSNGVVAGGLSGTAGVSLFFGIEVPADQKNLIIDTWDGTGDVTISAAHNALPDDTTYHVSGNNDNIYIKDPEHGKWYIRLYADEDISDLSVRAEYNTSDCNYTVYPMKDFFDADGGERTLLVDAENGCPWTAVKYDTWIEFVSETNGSITYRVLPNEDTEIRTDNIRITDLWMTVVQAGTLQNKPYELTDGVAQSVSGETDGNSYYQFDVPLRQKTLTIETSGGTGNCDLYVRYSELPTCRIYDFKSSLTDNDETLTIEEPWPGKWYIMADGYCSDISLKTQLTGFGVGDAISVLQILTGHNPDDSSTDSDFDNNGKVDIKDAIYVLQFIAGL